MAWSFVAGASPHYVVLIVARAFAGLGPAAYLPASIVLLGRSYRPGPRKNLVFSLFGGCAPLGFFIGIIVGGLMTEWVSWRWYFYAGSIVVAVVCAASIIVIPKEGVAQDEDKTSSSPGEHPHGMRMDWLGVITIVPGLLLFIFSVTEGAHAEQGWKTPYIIVTFILGILFLAAAFYVEGWVSEYPLLPFDLFKPKYMGQLVIALFFCYGAFGVFLLYASF
jgi:MFS family permease